MDYNFCQNDAYGVAHVKGFGDNFQRRLLLQNAKGDCSQQISKHGHREGMIKSDLSSLGHCEGET